jgi:iduronate 2-sulfatase
MNQSKALFFILAFYSLILTGCTEIPVDNVKKFNVLFIAIDDLRPELGCYGGKDVKTPNIDRLASQGLVFERAYCQVPTCGASRCSLMSGMLPTTKRFKTFMAKVDEDLPGAVTLPQVFKEAGYITLSNGKVFHHQSDSDKRSWSLPAWTPKIAKGHKSLDPATTKKLSKRKRGRIFESPDVPDNAYRDGKIAEKTIRDLKRLKASGKPFFLACGFYKPHMPFYAPKKYWDLYDRKKITLADNRYRPKNAPKSLKGSGEFKSYHDGGIKHGSDDWHRMMRHGYYACTSYSDKLVGDVLKTLKDLGLAENTIVVIWGDHGWHLGEHNYWGKHNTLHKALRIPLIIKVPGGASDKKTAALVESVDIYPTLCRLANLKAPLSLHGRSFDKLFTQPKQKHRAFSYSRFNSADAVVTDDFIYTRYDNGEKMLYNLKKDPGENINIAEAPENKALIVKLEKSLKERIEDSKK